MQSFQPVRRNAAAPPERPRDLAGNGRCGVGIVTQIGRLQNDGFNHFANPPVPPGPVLSFGLNTGGTYRELYRQFIQATAA